MIIIIHFNKYFQDTYKCSVGIHKLTLRSDKTIL